VNALPRTDNIRTTCLLRQDQPNADAAAMRSRVGRINWQQHADLG
jgi:hypothetical protein